jgi:hypothetical protein
MMRTKLGIAAALALSAFAVPSAVQAQDYYGHASYDHGRDHDRYDRHSWREHQRWERERAREHRRWEREHRHHGHGWHPYR